MAWTVKDRFRRLAILLVVLTTLAPSAGVSARQDDRVDAVTEAAIALSRLERDGDLLMMHDLLHPDVRLILSRAELAQWYAGPDTAIATADPEVISVEFGSWTWPVTGRTYADVASVTLRQPAIVNGASRELVELQHYWYDGARWRWFFGADMAYLDSLQAGVPAEPEPGGFADLEYARVNELWASIYDAAGATYRSPGAINITTMDRMPIRTGCGLVTEEENPGSFYCPLDEELYLSREFEAWDTWRFGDYSIRFTISHEWGHHIQVLEGIDTTANPELDDGYYLIEIELQADCLAGIYAQEAIARGWATEADLEVAYQVTEGIGDPPGTMFDDPSAHGSPDERRQAFTTGLEDGLFGCNLQPGMGG
jgi:predicted metalloprotease